MTRRQFVKYGLAAALVCATPWPVRAGTVFEKSLERSLSLYNTHTGEALNKIVYWHRGSYLAESLSEINYLLRDHRTDETARIDAGALDILFALRKQYPVGKPFEIISAYRSPATNNLLRRTSSGVAKTSFHTLGQAIDLRLPGVPLKKLRTSALRMKRGGVGYYPASDFIHIDTGPVRSW